MPRRLAAVLPSVDQATHRELVELSFRAADRYADAQQARHASRALLARHDAAADR